MGTGITWTDAIASKEGAKEATLAVFRTLGWNVLWQEADGNEAIPVLVAEPHDGTILAITLDPDFAARRGYVIMPVDEMLLPAAKETVTGGDYAWDDMRCHITVHGGISFSSTVADDDLDGLDTGGATLAVVGFDCLQIGDGTDTKLAREIGLPYTQAHPNEGTRRLPSSLALIGHPWADEEVIAECRRLARQLRVQQAA